MKKVLAILFLALLVPVSVLAGPRMRTMNLRFTDGATTAFTVDLAARDSAGTIDTDTTVTLDFSNLDWQGDSTDYVGLVEIRWPYSSTSGLYSSNDGDSLYAVWLGSMDDSIYTAGKWAAVFAADSNTTYSEKYKSVLVKEGFGAFNLPFGYRYYKLAIRNGSSGASPLGPGPDRNANLYSVRVRFGVRRAD